MQVDHQQCSEGNGAEEVDKGTATLCVQPGYCVQAKVAGHHFGHEVDSPMLNILLSFAHVITLHEETSVQSIEILCVHVISTQ